MKTKTKKIVFRVEENLNEFLREFANLNNMTMSELIRNVLIYFHTGFLLGEFSKPLSKLKLKYKKMYSKPAVYNKISPKYLRQLGIKNGKRA
jgi:hypothetical protein